MISHPLAVSTGLVFVLLGIFFLILVAIRPRVFWPLLIIASVGTGGLMIFRNTFTDEYLVYMVVLGGIMPMLVNQLRLQDQPLPLWQQWHKFFFLGFMGYMALESIRGMIVWESPGKMRWVIMFGMLAIITFFVSKKGFVQLTPRQMARLLCLSGFVYCLAYISHGLIAEEFRGISRFTLQPGEWSTSAYALFVLIVTVPSSLFLFKEMHRYWRWLARTSLLVSVAVSLYYFSRASLLVIIAFVFLASFQLGLRKILATVVLPLLIFTLIIFSSSSSFAKIMSTGWDELRYTVRDAVTGGSPDNFDIDRKVHFEAGLLGLRQNAMQFLVGSGFRTSGTVISPHLRRLYTDYGFPKLALKVSDDESTEAFTAFLIDTGMVGVTLLCINLLLTGYGIIRSGNSWRYVFLLTLLFAVLWLPIINILDIMVWYFLFMPFGILWQLTRSDPSLKENVI